MSLKLMDPRITVKLVEGHQNIIGPLAEERERFYQQQTCPRCAGAETTKKSDPRRMFVPGEPLPRFQLKCLNCGCVWDPFTNIIEELGNLADAFEPAIPLLNKEN